MTIRRVAIVTTSRADLSPLLPVMRAVDDHPALALEVTATGMHLADGHRGSLADLETAGFAPVAMVETIDGDRPENIGHAMARGVAGFTERFMNMPPDFLVVLGDRFDMFPAAIAALPFHIPVAHIHGGEVTVGAFDDQIRHSVSKMAHLHFVAVTSFSERLIRMGEEPWRITVCGAPGLDALVDAPKLDRAVIEDRTGIPASQDFTLVTVHPETLSAHSSESQIDQFLDAAAECPGWLLITAPNADPGGKVFRDRLQSFCQARPDALFIDNAGPTLYPNLLRHAVAIVGNSSSGIIEAGFFGKPVVNIGDRQAGRPAGENVINVPWNTKAIISGWREALSGEAAIRASGAESSYGRGDAGTVIAETLAATELGPTLLRKSFYDGATERLCNA